MNAKDLIKRRKQETKNSLMQNRLAITRIIEDKSVIGGNAIGRNPATGEWTVDTGNGSIRRAISIASSDITGKSVKVTINGHIGQIAEIPGFL